MFIGKNIALQFFLLMLGLAAAGTSEAGETETPGSGSDWQHPVSFSGERLRVAKGRLVGGLNENRRPVLAVQLEMAAGWHSYWHFPGAAGIAPEFDWTTPPGVSAGEPLFPVPQRFDEPGGPTNGYAGTAAFIVPLQFAAPDARAKLGLNLTLGLCREICVPASFSFSIKTSLDELRNSPHQDWLNGRLSELPGPPGRLLSLKRVTFGEGALDLEVAGRDLSGLDVFVAGGAGDFFDRPEIISMSSGLGRIRIAAETAGEGFTGRRLDFALRTRETSVMQSVRVEPKKSGDEK